MNIGEWKAQDAVKREVKTHLSELLAKHRLSIDARGIGGWSQGHPDFENPVAETADRHLRDAIQDFMEGLK